MSFGFSVGDFVAAINLIDNITSALNSATGSAAEVRSLFQSLSSLSTSLTITKDFYANFNDTNNTEETIHEIAKTIYAAVNEQLRQCVSLIRGFAKSIDGYGDVFVTGKAKGLGRQLKKITWLRKKEDVVAFERSLAFYLRTVENYNSLLNM